MSSIPQEWTQRRRESVLFALRPVCMIEYLCILQIIPTTNVLACSASAIDDNANGLSDVWEQQFHASALELLQDDYDGFNNLEECIAGTDPFNAQDLPSLRPDFIQDAAGEMQISFQTVGGKHYSVNHSTELSQFAPINKGWIGDGAVRELTIRKDGRGESVSPIRADFWANLPGTDMDALDALSNYPHAPDGSVHTYYPEAPRFAASHYGARIHSGSRLPRTRLCLHLSAGGPAELYWIDDSANKIAEILPLGKDCDPASGTLRDPTRGASGAQLRALPARIAMYRPQRGNMLK